MKNIFYITFTLLFFVYGQTDVQINQAKKIIKAKGLTEAQVRKQASLRGYSDQKINDIAKKNLSSVSKPDTKSNKEVESINFGTSNRLNQSSEVIDTQSLLSDESIKAEDGKLTVVGEEKLEIVDESAINIDSKPQSESLNVSYFGYEIFKRDPALFQATSVGAIDDNYLIGPGDEIIVMLWGETQFRQVLKVNREGFIFIPEIGQVFVNGLSMSLLESKLFRVLSQSYASLNPYGGKATTFLDISLGNLRPLRIQVLGEVSQPGAYTVSPSATLFSALYYFNGPTTLGSLRDIQLIRGGVTLSNIDFYDYLLTGKSPNDQNLQLDDVIFVPRRMKTVTIKGEINRPGIYELKPGEDLKDILSMAGDLKITAYQDRIQIDRIVSFDKREELGMDRMYTDVNIKELNKMNNSFDLQDGDVIQIFSVLDLRQNVVDIRGSVTRPGKYDIGDSLSLSQLILKADSLSGDAYLERVDVVRTKSDFTEELIRLNLDKVINNDPEHDILLTGLDRVRVYGKAEMVSKTFVSISGHVKNPGIYSLQKNMNLHDLVFKAGGYIDPEFKKEAYMDRAELVRRNNKSGRKEIIPFNLISILNNEPISKMILNADDAVRIYSAREIKGQLNSVLLSGHVKNPGKYELYEENMTLYDLLFKAGGFNDNVFKSNTLLERADLIRYENDRIIQKIINFNLGEVLSSQDSKENYILYPDDEVKIYSKEVFNRARYVSIGGVVRNPGSFKYKVQMSLKDLILEAGGVSENVYRYKVEIARINPNNKTETNFAESIQFDLNNDFSIINKNNDFKSTSSNQNNNFALLPYDRVSVRPDPYFGFQKNIEIKGEVYYPGSYSILRSDETIFDIIKRAGGLRSNAYLEGSTFERNGERINLNLRNIVKKPKHGSNMIINHGDVLTIVKKPNTIQLIGEFSSPGFYAIRGKQRLKQVIKSAGGLTQEADSKNIIVIYPGGKSKKYKSYLSNPKVFEGSVLKVGKQKEKEPLDKTEFFKEVASIIGSLAQTIGIIILASR